VQYKNTLAMIFNEIKCQVKTSLGLVGGCIPCIPPCVRACIGLVHFSDWKPGRFRTSLAK